MTSPEICRIMSEAFRETIPGVEIISLPMADGGDGTVRTLAYAMNAEIRTKKVCGPLGDDVVAEYAYHSETKCGIIEMASASGIALIPRSKLNPIRATTYGTGQLLKAVMDDGAETVIMGIGGSATVDGGTGMARALGFHFLDKNGNEIPADMEQMKNLSEISCKKVDPRLKKVNFSVACDVTSPLLGPDGAATVFGPQKGATPEMVGILENSLSSIAKVWLQQGMLNSVEQPGDGAAGGLGAGLRAFCSAKSVSGAKLVMNLLHFEEHLKDADLVITGEGQTDVQTQAGKLCAEIAKKAHEHGVPVMLLSGALAKNDKLDSFNDLFDYAFSISSGHTNLESALQSGPDDLMFFCRNLGKLLRKG